MDRSGFLFAVVLGLLAHSLIGYAEFPMGDDFAYGPLAEHRADPSLYPRDDQLRLFENHARLYEWVYRLGDAGPGVEPVFRVVIWLLAAAVAVILLVVLKALGAPTAALPVVLGVGVIVRMGGLGRGSFGGLVSPFFHHHYVALALVLGAVAAALYRKSWLAGVFLGCAAYAQPMTAFHGALVAGLGALARHPAEALRMAIAAIIVALPAALLMQGMILGASEGTATLDLVRDAYRFRSPTHYDPTWAAVGLSTLYLFAGWAGVVLLAKSEPQVARFSAGVMAGFSVLHLVTVGVYKAEISDWIPYFILDATRSTPALFALGPALALAGLWRAPQGPVAWVTGGLLLTITALNSTLAGLAFVVLGAVILALGKVPRARSVLALGLAAALVALFPPAPGPPSVPDPTRVALERIRAETPPDALFVIPISLSAFRHFAQRSAYVDFKLFSVAQPDQAELTRTRIDEVTRPGPEHRTARGWKAARLWDENQRHTATCAVMTETLTAVGADYYLRMVAPDETPPDCPALPRPIRTETLALYGPSG